MAIVDEGGSTTTQTSSINVADSNSGSGSNGGGGPSTGGGGSDGGGGPSTGGDGSSGGAGTSTGGGTSTGSNPDTPGSGATQSPAASPVPVAGVGPSLARIERLGVHDQPARLVLTFSESLDPARAVDPANFEVLAAGRDGILGDRDDVVVPIAAVVYQPASRTVALKMARPINIHHPYRLTVRGSGSNGISDPAGRPGGDAEILVTWKDIVLRKHGGGGIIGPGELRRLVWPRGHRSPE